MRVDPELQDTVVDTVFSNYGKIINPTQKIYKQVEGVPSPINMGNRKLTIELHNPEILPPNTLSLTNGMQNLVLFTVPGTSKSNQEIAFEDREKKRKERADKEAAEIQEQKNKEEKERAEQEQEEERKRIEREEQHNHEEIDDVQRDHTRDNNPPDETLTSDNNPPEETPDNTENTDESYELPSAHVPTKCESCGLDLSSAVNHGECGEKPVTVDQLTHSSKIDHGLKEVSAIIQELDKKNPKIAANRLFNILANSHPSYITSITDRLGMQITLCNESLARIAFLACTSEPDRNGCAKVLREELDRIKHHPKITNAITDLHLCPARGSSPINTKTLGNFTITTLTSCLHVLP